MVSWLLSAAWIFGTLPALSASELHLALRGGYSGIAAHAPQQSLRLIFSGVKPPPTVPMGDRNWGHMIAADHYEREVRYRAVSSFSSADSHDVAVAEVYKFECAALLSESMERRFASLESKCPKGDDIIAAVTHSIQSLVASIGILGRQITAVEDGIGPAITAGLLPLEAQIKAMQDGTLRAVEDGIGPALTAALLPLGAHVKAMVENGIGAAVAGAVLPLDGRITALDGRITALEVEIKNQGAFVYNANLRRAGAQLIMPAKSKPGHPGAHAGLDGTLAAALNQPYPIGTELPRLAFPTSGVWTCQDLLNLSHSQICSLEFFYNEIFADRSSDLATRRSGLCRFLRCFFSES